MNYQEFVGSVTSYLKETLPCGTEMNFIPLEKNNGVVMEGLSVRKRGQKVAPTIYLEPYYGEYLSGCSLHHIYDKILECCEDCDFMEPYGMDFFSDYKNVRPTVVYKLINYEKNKELLARIPHVPYLDLAIVFYCLLAETPVGNATVLIYNSHMELWNVTCGDLYRDARKNVLRLLPAELKSMTEVIRELSDGLEDLGEDSIPMYVLTNSRKILGAACILYDGMLKGCALQIEDAFYLLPSSIHEVILVPKSVISDSRELISMVREINETQVRNTEVLSNQIYFYSPESGRLSLLKEL
ncbi:MAG: hypothetical protein HFJ10_03830 [Lachnospiraceae bacterium]|nr:hypothetical protein [Lachnospiraceae bacterium]